MKKLLLVALTVAIFACHETYSQAYMPAEKDVKEFFEQLDNGVLTKKPFLLVKDIIQGEGGHKYFEHYLDGKDTDIAKDDLAFIVKEMEASHGGIWTAKFFDSAKIASKGYIDSVAKLNPLEIPPANYKFSPPWFSEDKKYCVLYYEHYCGRLCGEWSTRLYKKVNGKWIFVKYYEEMVS